MDPGKVTVRDLFAAPVRYIVPRFQRDYVWNQQIQWEPLWQDIADTAQELMSRCDKIGDPLVAMGEMSPHFMGAVVLKQKLTTPGEPTNRIIVDGQQRLTTLQIVMVSLVHSLVELNRNLAPDVSESLNKRAETVSALTINHGMAGEFRFKIRPFDDDFNVFAQLLDKGECDVAPHAVAECYRYFKQTIKGWMKEGPQGIESKADALITTIFDLIMIFTLNLVPQEDEYLIFETLNARAEPLSEWDKAKNHFIAKSTGTAMSENEFYDEFIDEFDTNGWWKEDAQQPRFQGSRVGLFFNHWLEIELSESVPARRAYHRFRQYLRNQPDVLSIAGSFKAYAEIFEKIETQPQDGSIQGLFRYRRGALRAGVIVPTVMRLHRLLGPSKALDECTKIIESYLVRRQIRGSNTRGYDTLFMSVLQKISQADKSKDVATVLIDSLEGSALEWPSDSSVLDAVLGMLVYPGVSQSRLRMILEAVEDHLMSDLAGHPAAPQGLWIEHIMPQGWSAHWPLPDEAGENAEAARDRAIATLGNLTLTNSKLDIRLSNLPWPQKREILRKHDNLFINKHLLDNAPNDRWDEETILDRGKRLASIITQIWPNADSFKLEIGSGKAY